MSSQQQPNTCALCARCGLLFTFACLTKAHQRAIDACAHVEFKRESRGMMFPAAEICNFCFKIAHRERTPCAYCGKLCFPTRDHIVPKCRGGKETAGVCSNCNQSKGSKSLQEWLQSLPINAPQQWLVPVFLQSRETSFCVVP